MRRLASIVICGIFTVAAFGLYFRSIDPVELEAMSDVDQRQSPSSVRMKVALNTPLLTENSKPRKHPKFTMEPWSVNASSSGTEYFRSNPTDHTWSSITIVKSGIKNKGRRDAIRKTWGAIKFMDGVRFATVFIIGKTDVVGMQEDLQKENDLHGDLLQTDIPDTTENLPLKIEAGMLWTSLNFDDDWLYSSADDDMVLHPPNFARHVDSLVRSEKGPGSSAMKALPMICVYGFVTKGRPDRNKRSKWYMPADLYPNPYWPPYCRGGWYSMPVSTVARIHAVSRTTPILYLDDVWLTGLIRLKMYNEGTGIFHVGTLLSEQGIVGAPLADRTDTQFYYRTFEGDLNRVIVSHTWGNYGLFPTDVVTEVRNTWERWKASVWSRMRNVVI